MQWVNLIITTYALSSLLFLALFIHSQYSQVQNLRRHGKSSKSLAATRRDSDDDYPKTIRNVIIAAEHRTGSTFFSEIFNQHPDIFYLYEPLSILSSGHICYYDENSKCNIHNRIHKKLNDTLFNLQIRILNDFFEKEETVLENMDKMNKNNNFDSCRLPWADKFLHNEWLINVGATVGDKWLNCLNDGVCNRARNQKLLSEKYCKNQMGAGESQFQNDLADFMVKTGLNVSQPQDVEVVMKNMKERELLSRTRRRSLERCEPIDRSLATDECKNSTIRAVKLIRLESLTSLNLLKNDPKSSNKNSLGPSNLFTYYLVRDPRGTANSRFDIRNTDKRVENEISKLPTICDRHKQNLKAIKKYQWKNVIVARYEDLVMDPFNQANYLLSKINLPMPVNLVQWYNLNMGFKSSSGSYGTSRSDPVQTAFKWTSSMNFEHVEMIQNNCREVMQAFGYKLFDNRTSFENSIKDGSNFSSIDQNWRSESVFLTK